MFIYKYFINWHALQLLLVLIHCQLNREKVFISQIQLLVHLSNLEQTFVDIILARWWDPAFNFENKRYFIVIEYIVIQVKENSISRNGHEIEKMKTFFPCILHEFPINKIYGAP